MIISKVYYIHTYTILIDFFITYRLKNEFDQIYPKLSGFLLQLRIHQFEAEKITFDKTLETYLPPLTTKVTDPNTIYSYLLFLQSLAEKSNMPYVNITLDVGAAMNAFKIVWQYHDLFSNVVIHLGDFHFMKENFKVWLYKPLNYI